MEEELYSTSDLGKGTAIAMVLNQEPTLRRNPKGFLELCFPRTPETFSAVLAFDSGELRLDPKIFAVKHHAAHKMAHVWRYEAGGAR